MEFKKATVGRGSYVVMGLGAAGWALLLLIYIPAVQGLYDRGYGSSAAITTYIGIPIAGLMGSVVVPLALRYLGLPRSAKAVAVISLLAFLPAFFITAMLGAI